MATEATEQVQVEVDTSDYYDKPEDLSTQTAIQNRYAFWYHRRGKTVSNYEETMTLLASFQTVEHFWRVYNHIIRPNDIKTTTDYHIFKDGVKPTWEDAANQNGGKWMVRLRKGLSSRLWEELVLAIIGEQFDVGHEICGAVLSVRTNEDIISVWNKTADNVEATNKIRDQLRRILKIPAAVVVEYKKHQDSLADRSSFRNPSFIYKFGNRPHDNRGPPNYTKGGHHGGNQGYSPKPNDGGGDGQGQAQGQGHGQGHGQGQGQGQGYHGQHKPAWKSADSPYGSAPGMRRTTGDGDGSATPSGGQQDGPAKSPAWGAKASDTPTGGGGGGGGGGAWSKGGSGGVGGGGGGGGAKSNLTGASPVGGGSSDWGRSRTTGSNQSGGFQRGGYGSGGGGGGGGQGHGQGHGHSHGQGQGQGQGAGHASSDSANAWSRKKADT